MKDALLKEKERGPRRNSEALAPDNVLEDLVECVRPAENVLPPLGRQPGRNIMAATSWM